MNVIVPKLEYAGEAREGNAKSVKQWGNSTDGSSWTDTRMLTYDEQCSIKNRAGNSPTQDKQRRENARRRAINLKQGACQERDCQP